MNEIHLHFIASAGSVTLWQREVSESIQEFMWVCGSVLKLQLSI